MFQKLPLDHSIGLISQLMIVGEGSDSTLHSRVVNFIYMRWSQWNVERYADRSIIAVG